MVEDKPELSIWQAVDPDYPGYRVYFETAEAAFRWRRSVVEQYGDAPNIIQHCIPDYGALIAFLNGEYNRDQADDSEEDPAEGASA